MKYFARFLTISTVTLAVLASTGASAEILAAAARTNSQGNSGTQLQPVLLNDAGRKALRFTTTENNTTVSFAFYHACLVTALDNTGNGVIVQIQVDGTAVNPSFGGGCTKPGGQFASDEVGAIYLGVLRVPNAGLHVARAFARMTSGSGNGQWTFHGNSLVVAK
jgi:hypothetical protein